MMLTVNNIDKAVQSVVSLSPKSNTWIHQEGFVSSEETVVALTNPVDRRVFDNCKYFKKALQK